MTQTQPNILILKFDAHKPPTFKERRGKDWIEYGSEKPWRNTYPDFLIHLYNESATHNTIINGKTKYIAGQGWFINNDHTTLEEKTQIQGFINNAGDESLFSLTTKLALDRELFGGFALRPVWNKAKTKVTLHHIDFSKIRVDKEGDKFYYTSDWTTQRPESNEDFETLTPFDPEKKTEKTLIYYKDYRPDLKEYPLPNYQAGINYISSDIDIATFIAANTSNGFSGGTIINFFNGEPTPEAAQDIERQFKNKFTGPDKAGATMLNFADPDKQGAEVVPLADNGQDDRFNSLNTQVQEKIFISHQATNPVLFGVKAENGLGNNADEIRTASEHLQNSYVTPQQRVFEDLMNEILVINGLPKGIKIQDIEPVKRQLSEATLERILSEDELRESAGYQPKKKQFKAERTLFTEMEQMGFTDDQIEVVSEEDLLYNPFVFAVTEVDRRLMDIIKGNPNTTVAELAQATGESVEQTNLRLTTLRQDGLIEIAEGRINIKEPVDPPEEKLVTVYKYVERDNVPSAKSGSRDFCRQILAFGRNYTREQIGLLRNEFGTNVFLTKGGWYHNPTTNVTTPYCRHVWRARTVKLK